MRQISTWLWFAGAAVLLPAAARASVGPTCVRLRGSDFGSQVQSLEFRGSTEVRPSWAAYGTPNSGATPEILSHVGEILGAMDNPERRTQLAEQWLQYSKQVIAKEQESRDQWLQLQRQELAQQQEADQLRLQMAQLQMRIEQLHAENLRLQQENLQAQRQLSERAGASAPRPSLPTPPSP